MSDLGENLPSLEYLQLFGNQLEGSISQFISNATSLKVFELAQNHISGVIPSKLGQLKSLELIDLHDNYFQAEEEKDWSFISSLAYCRHLMRLEMYNNSLGGALPSTITNLSSSLEVLRLERNKIEGTIPDGWERFLNISMLKFGVNKLRGKIPDSFGKLNSLKVMFLEENELSGEIPPSLGNLSGLLELSLGGNQQRGKIPLSLGDLSKLQSLDLSSNDCGSNACGSKARWLWTIFHNVRSMTFTCRLRRHVRRIPPTSSPLPLTATPICYPLSPPRFLSTWQRGVPFFVLPCADMAATWLPRPGGGGCFHSLSIGVESGQN